MAARLERAFAADGRALLELQAQIDRPARDTSERALTVRRYVPNFLVIKAAQIDQWPDNNLDARPHLPVMLRRLVHSTGEGLRQVDFPGYDNAQRHGWDGWIEADAATAWIPKGKSGWEFGVDADPRQKANDDFKSRLTVPAAERRECTFVFVTPRNWPGKTAWEKEKNALGEWKAVRALDASDLEQWLEESVPAQLWLAEKLRLRDAGCRTLDEFWARWSGAAQPPLPPALFAPSVNHHRDTFKRWLDSPPDRVFIVSADSAGEAVAFLACLFNDSEIAPRVRDLTAYFESADTLRSLAGSTAPFLAVVASPETEKELAPLYRRFHTIAVRPRNDVQAEPDIALDLLTHEAFTAALSAMGITGDEADRLERESGRSPTVLRRRRSTIPAIKTPPWAEDVQLARSLLPAAFVGAWQATSPADAEVLAALAGRPYAQVEEGIARLRQADDCPVWSIAQYHGVTSKLDALFALSGHITRPDLDAFFKLAANVLAEIDPSLDLPEDQRWAANIYGKVRNHSGALRRGICETLVILSVHGDEFRRRTGVDVQAEVSRLVRDLLEPLTTDKLLSHERDLPRYAEAAPELFLSIIEADLAKPDPAAYGLLKPVSSGVFSICPRTGLLWALEGLAWKHLGRVNKILARMSRIKIDDNWANKPIGSLAAIYRSWMPQTAAPLAERIKALEVLTRDFPDIGWELCLDQFDRSQTVGHYSHKPEWRNDASGAGEPRGGRERYEFCRKALDLAIAWPSHTASTLGDLVQHMEGISDEDKAKVWDLIDSWAARETNEKSKAALRETIRRFAFTRRGRRRGLTAATADRARKASAALAPQDPVVRNAWLFAKDWVEESAEEFAAEDFDFTKREERIDAARRSAISEIWPAKGFDGIKALLTDSEAPFVIGRYAAAIASDVATAVGFALSCLALDADPQNKPDRCLEGFLVALDQPVRAAVLDAVLEGADDATAARLLRCAPFRHETWVLADAKGPAVAALYWGTVSPWWRGHTDEDRLELIDRLLAARRPRAAFFAVHHDWDKVETSRLRRILQDVATVGDEGPDRYRLDPHERGTAVRPRQLPVRFPGGLRQQGDHDQAPARGCLEQVRPGRRSPDQQYPHPHLRSGPCHGHAQGPQRQSRDGQGEVRAGDRWRRLRGRRPRRRRDRRLCLQGLPGPPGRIQGSIEPCIYCTSTQQRVKREHVMSQALGTFEQNWTLDCVCDDCNEHFGDNLELPLGRDSLEALLRVQLGIKPPEAAASILYRRVSPSLSAPGPFDGVRLAMAAVNGEILPDAPAQVALRAPGGEWHFITEKRLTRERIEEVSRGHLEVRVFGRTGTDDTQRLVRRLAELGVPFQETARVLDQPLTDGPSMTVVHDLDIDVMLQRAVAKISFNYLAYTLGAETARRPAFDTIRRFIRYSEAPHRLASAQEASALVGPAAAESRAHVCAVGWEPTRQSLVGVVSLFNTLMYGVQLARPETDEWTTTCVAHAFDPIARTISALPAAGERVSTPPA